MPHIQALFSNIYFLAFSSAIVAWGLSLRMFPVIIHTVRAKNLMDEPEDRSMHSTKTPTLGGVGLFAAFTLTLLIFGISVGLERPDLLKLLSLLGATMILLFLGIKDDLIAMSPKKKFIGQLIASAIVIIMTDVRVGSFDGLLGIGELPYVASVLFTLFVFILVINSFNLIDGIDGLAGTVATISSVAFGIFFLFNENYLLVLVSFIIIGALLGFLKYNLSKERKLFMGDSGSLFLGFLLAYQGISFLNLNESETALYTVANAPILLLAILSFPLLDTLRVFAIRAKERRSPFSPDSNHIHHRLLNLGLTHKQATALVFIANVLIIELAFLLGDLYINVQLVICVSMGSILYLIPFLKIFEKDMKLAVVRTKEDQQIIMEQVLANKGPIQKTKASYTWPVKNGAANNKTAAKAMQLPIGEESIAEIEKSQKLKVISKRLAVFKKLPKTRIPYKKTAN